MIRKLLTLAVLAGILTTGLVACNTTEGAGKDIKHAGQGIENAAERNK